MDLEAQKAVYALGIWWLLGFLGVMIRYCKILDDNEPGTLNFANRFPAHVLYFLFLAALLLGPIAILTTPVDSD